MRSRQCFYSAVAWILCAWATSTAARSFGQAVPDARGLHDAGLDSLRQRSQDDARESLLQAERLHPASAHTLLLKGHLAMMADGDDESAQHLYTLASASTQSEREEADVAHAFGRLYRQQLRWEEADESYKAAMAMVPSDMGIAEEGLFVRGKRLLLQDAPADALAQFERGSKLARALWQPHYAREMAHALGFLGDVDATMRQYEAALRIGGLPDRAAIGDLLSTFAVHHERLQALPTAGSFLSGAHAALTSALEAPLGAEREAAVHLKLARTSAGLHALGALPPVPPSDALPSPAGACRLASDSLPGYLDVAAAHYERAIELHPTLVAAYDELGALLLGCSRLCNFGASHAAGLNLGEAGQLLRTAERLSASASHATASLAKAADGGSATTGREVAEARGALLEALEGAARDVVQWDETVRALDETPPAASDPSKAKARPAHAAELSGAAEVPRVEARDSEALMALLHARTPVVVTNLQSDAGFAPHAAWRASALAEAAGDRVVRVSISQSGRFDGAEPGSLWGLGEGDEVLVRPPETHMRLRSLLSLLQHPTAESFYLEYAPSPRHAPPDTHVARGTRHVTYGMCTRHAARGTRHAARGTWC